MTRKPIIAEEASGPVAEVLKTHTAERAKLLENLTRWFEAVGKVRAAWLWGSFQRGEQDDLSDLDLWLLVQDDGLRGFGEDLTRMCRASANVVFAGENAHNAPADGGYLGVLFAGSHGLHHADIYWQPVSKVELPPGPLLLDRTGESTERIVANVLRKPTGSDPNAVRIAFVWLMLSVTAKYLARDPDSDMALLQYPRNAFEETATALGLADLIAQTNWQIPERPEDKVDKLRHIAGQTALLEKACPSASQEANPCLMRYFDLVQEIIRTA